MKGLSKLRWCGLVSPRARRNLRRGGVTIFGLGVFGLSAWISWTDTLGLLVGCVFFAFVMILMEGAARPARPRRTAKRDSDPSDKPKRR
jgi:hypothetical protein